jgi:hypothetical protein
MDSMPSGNGAGAASSEACHSLLAKSGRRANQRSVSLVTGPQADGTRQTEVRFRDKGTPADAVNGRRERSSYSESQATDDDSGQEGCLRRR